MIGVGCRPRTTGAHLSDMGLTVRATSRLDDTKTEVVDDEIQFIKSLTKGEKDSEERLVVSEAKVGTLECEVTKGMKLLKHWKLREWSILK